MRRPAESLAAEAAFRREIAPWALLGLTLGLVEGATAAVLIKKTFADAADPWIVNLAVAFVSGAPALSNVVSFVWANLAHGRARIGLMVALQAALRAAGGLVRRRAARARRPGVRRRLDSGGARDLDRHPHGARRGVERELSARRARPLHRAHRHREFAGGVGRPRRWPPGCSTRRASTRAGCSARGAAAGLLAAWLYRAARVRREFALLAEENAAVGRTEPFSLGMLFEILRKDPHFREYMFWMGVFGGGNLMLTSQLVVIFSEHLHLRREPADRAAVGGAARPAAAVRAVLGAHVRRGHVVEYRARQGWALVAAVALVTVGTWLHNMPLLWVGAVVLAFAYAGSNLGWNLGHNDFASVGRAQHYMGVHVTLTGVRGAIGPPAGILIYQWLESHAAGHRACIRWCCRSCS